MTYLGLSGAKQISRELTAGEISDVVSNAEQNIPKFSHCWYSITKA
jgi:hypothetical protein